MIFDSISNVKKFLVNVFRFLMLTLISNPRMQAGKCMLPTTVLLAESCNCIYFRNM